MKLVRNTGTDRVIDLLRPELASGRRVDVVTSALSIFAFAEMRREIETLTHCRLLLPPTSAELGFLGSNSDRAARNRLQSRWIANRLMRWLQDKAEVRTAHGAVPQGAFVVRDADGLP